jgi:hypothetical protein
MSEPQREFNKKSTPVGALVACPPQRDSAVFKIGKLYAITTIVPSGEESGWSDETSWWKIIEHDGTLIKCEGAAQIAFAFERSRVQKKAGAMAFMPVPTVGSGKTRIDALSLL